mgnify:CR=1 FL=1
MKKIFLLLLSVFFISNSLFATTNDKHIFYLDNPSNEDIEIILDIENKVKKLEENYNIEDVEKVKANLDFWTRFIRIWKLKKEHNYGKEDDEVLEIFDERLKNLRERLETLESKYQ